MLSMKEYLTLAETSIVRWGNPTWMLQEDYISAVATKIMMADHTYDATQKMSANNWRIQNARWAIYGLFQKHHRKIQPVDDCYTVSLEDSNLANTLADDRSDSYNMVEKEEDDFEDMISHSGVSDGDKQILRMKFLDELSDEEIGKRLGNVSKQAIQKRRRRAYGLIRQSIEFRNKAAQ